MYNGLMKITQPTSMAASLQMNSQHMCIECLSWQGGVNYQTQIVNTKLPIVIPSTTNTISHVKLKNEVTICIW